MPYCMYCDEPLHNNPFTFGYAERAHSLLRPWAYVHKVAEHGIKSNLVGDWPTINYKREKCTK